MSLSKSFFEKENPIGDYLLNEEIGSGGFAKVVQAIHIPTGEKVAVKIMDKAQIFSEPLNLNRIQREIAILKIVRHNNIIKLYELMETPDKIYIVMEYCNGGELFDYIVSKQHLTERQACRFFQEIINCLEYLHSLNIVHRDIKPENLLLYKIKNKINLKLIDFGISNCYTMDKLLSTPCGTASYAPPEMHKGEEYYGLLSDIWSAGVVLYAMVFGYLPFCEDDEDINIKNIIEGNYEIPDEASPELADLLVHLLDINPLTRYDLDQIKEHPWFNMVKNYKFIPGIIEGYNKIPIDMKIVDLCEQHGYDRNEVIENVQKCNYNRNSAVYYILLSKLKREGYHSISDLYSDEFLKYVNNPKNLLIDVINEESKEKNITKYQSHPVSDNKLMKGKDKINKNKKDKNMKKENINLDINSHRKNKSINKRQKQKSKKNNDLNININNNLQENRKAKNIKKEVDKKENTRINKSIPKKNNYSFSQSKKVENKEKPKIKNKENKKYIPKIDLTSIQKQYQNQSIKTEIVQNQNNNEKLMPICSFHIVSKTKEILNSINNNEVINLDFINTSFNKKLSDDIKENILKLKNPKKNISQKEKEKKINKALLSLKMKKRKKKRSNRNKKINFKFKESIFKENNPNKEHTIIHNRNASLVIENRNEKNNREMRNRNDFYFSPDTKRRAESNERRNIINIYVQNKNSANSHNIYNINLITKNNYSIDKSNESKNKNNNNIKVKKIKISNQNIKYLLDKKEPINNPNYSNTTNISNKKNQKIDFQTSYKSQVISNNNNEIESKNRPQSQRENKKDINNTNNNIYNNSFNSMNKNKKRIRITFKSIEEDNIYDTTLTKKEKIKIKNMKNNNIIINKYNINNNRYYHYKSRSLMDIDNPNNLNQLNNYTITENKVENNFSSRYSSVKNVNNRNSRNNSIKQRKRMMNISFVNIKTNSNQTNNIKQIEPKKYKGPIDLKCLLYSMNINQTIEKISNTLKRNKMNVIYIGLHKLRCTKNGQSYDIEFFGLYNKINFSSNNSYLYENEPNLKTFSGKSNYKQNKSNNFNVYYYTITSKVCNNKKLIKIISRIIYSKFFLGKNKKGENI